MESSQARSLIRDTCTQPFDKGRFKTFIANMLNDINESKAARWTKIYVKEAFRPRVKWYERIATYTDPNGEKLDTLIVYLERQSSLERARTSLRNFVADYLTTGHGQDKSAVLAAFVSPDETDWRFSFVKLEYESVTDVSGKVKVTETRTPARRYSFLVGAHEHSHTAQKQFLPLLERDHTKPLLEEIEKAFDIEKVTKEFFQRYKDLFDNVRDALENILEKNTPVREDFEKKGIATDDFAKKLLGQIVFLYFLQKKGWFGVDRGNSWGTGDKNYLYHLFRKRETYYRPGDKRNFFDDILEPLFYNTLAVERTDDYSDRFHCKIPFLNGGLFEPLFGYDWVNTELLLPDRLFSNSELTKEGDVGTGILDVFNRYNFTVNEAEPLEKEVAVDPEMLGKVFENLLPENLRHKGGTYYTPRPIVSYMCQESLINYLTTHLPDVPREDIERFIRIGYVQADFQAAGTNKQKAKFGLPQVISRNAPKIDELLENITVCDPAIGSGAFPVGMMQEIVRAREALVSVEGMKHSTYELKRHVIQNSLYGVDIDPGAIEIAKLRLWLSLVVDEDDRRSIQALPNLDYKIMQGNSLLDEFAGVRLLDDDLITQAFVDSETQISALNLQINERDREIARIGMREGRRSPKILTLEQEIKGLKKQRDAIYRQADKPDEQATFRDLHSTARAKLAELKELHREFFDTASVSRKRVIRERLETLEWEFMEATLKERGEEEALHLLARYRRDNRKNYFLWKLHFVEVFQSKGGFDVVIGNPPYLRADSGDEHLAMRKAIERSGRYETLWEKWDLYVAFIERGYKLLRPSGLETMIVSDAYCHSKYAQKSQNWFLRNSRVLRLDFLSKLQIFEAAVRNIIVFLQKADGLENRPERLTHASEFGDVIALPTAPQAELTYRAFFPEDVKARTFHVPTVKLHDVCYISKGMVVHADEKEAQGAFELSDLVSNNRDRLHPKPFVEGKHLARWLPAMNKWLEWNTGRAPALFSRPTFKEMYEVDEKLISVDMAAGVSQLRVAYDNRRLYHNHSAWSFIRWQDLSKVRNNSIKKVARYQDERPLRPDLPRRKELENISRRFNIKFLLGVMNSSLARDFLRANRRSNIHLYPDDWKKLPIVEATKQQQAPIVKLVDRILAAKRANENADVSQFEAEIDHLVYKLYGLTEDEIAIVENGS
jgi:adenine-specific DNA-methyltransferase